MIHTLVAATQSGCGAELTTALVLVALGAMFRGGRR